MNRKIKILFLASTLGGGGTEKRTVDILKSIDSNIFDPVLCVWEKTGIYVKDVPPSTKFYAVKKRNTVLTLINMYKVFRKEKPDIIFGNMWKINAAAALILKLTFFKKKVKLIFGIVTNPSFIKHQRFFRFLYGSADLFVVNSKGIRDYLISAWKVPKEKTQVIFNGIDIQSIDRFSEKKTEHPWINKNFNLVVSVGRLSEPKGHPDLIEALAIANKKKSIHLLIIGQGGEEENLRRLAVEKGIENRVDFLGFAHNPYKYMAKADLFILSSLWEGFPNVVLEAMACRIPVLSTDAPFGPSEIIEDGVNGYLVPVADPARLAEKIIDLIENKDKQEIVIRQARLTVEEKYTLEGMTSHYEKLFHSICLEKNL